MMTTITFNIDEDLKKELKQYALNEGKTVTELLHKWIKENIRKEI